LNSNFSSSNRASFDCSGDSFKSAHQPNMTFLGNAVYQPDACSLGRSYEDLYDDESENCSVNINDFDKEEFSAMDELNMWERLFVERELNRMRISSLLSKAQCEARNYTFLEKLMMKQQRLRQFLNEENRRRALILRSKLPKKDGLSAQPSKIGSREMFGQSQSTGQKSEHASSLECQTQTGSRKTSQLEKPCKKTRNCRHFLKSHC